MRGTQILFSLVALCLSLLLIALGVGFLLAPTLLERLNFTWLGIGCLGVGFLLLALFKRLLRRQSVVIEMGGKRRVTADTRTLAMLAEKSIGVPCHVAVHRGGKLEFLVDMPYPSEESALRKVEDRLASALEEYFGYTKPFLLNLRPPLPTEGA